MVQNELKPVEDFLEMILILFAKVDNLREVRKYQPGERVQELEQEINNYALEVNEKSAKAMTVLHSLGNPRLNSAFTVVMETASIAGKAMVGDLSNWKTVQGNFRLAVSNMLAEMRKGPDKNANPGTVPEPSPKSGPDQSDSGITVGDINDSTAVAIGQNITLIVNQWFNSPRDEDDEQE